MEMTTPFPDYGNARFVWPLRVYYGDTDAAGVVYYANYLRLCENARTEWLRDMGINQSAFRDETGLVFVVRSVTADYRASALLDDVVDIVTVIEDVRRVKATFLQQMMRGDECLFEARIVVACVDMNRKKVSPFPTEIHTLFSRLATA